MKINVHFHQHESKNVFVLIYNWLLLFHYSIDTHTVYVCVCIYIYIYVVNKKRSNYRRHSRVFLSLSLFFFFFFFVNRWGYLDIFKYLTILFGICSLPNFKPKFLWISWDFKNLEHSHQLFYKKCHFDILKAYFIILTHHFTIHHLSHLLFFDSKH